MKVDKFKRQATLRVSTGGNLDVNFFLDYSTEEHPATFSIPIEALYPWRMSLRTRSS